MNPNDIGKLQILNDLIAQTIDAIGQRTVGMPGAPYGRFGGQPQVGGLSHSGLPYGYGASLRGGTVQGAGLGHTASVPWGVPGQLGAQGVPYGAGWGQTGPLGGFTHSTLTPMQAMTMGGQFVPGVPQMGFGGGQSGWQIPYGVGQFGGMQDVGLSHSTVSPWGSVYGQFGGIPQQYVQGGINPWQNPGLGGLSSQGIGGGFSHTGVGGWPQGMSSGFGPSPYVSNMVSNIDPRLQMLGPMSGGLSHTNIDPRLAMAGGNPLFMSPMMAAGGLAPFYR